MNFDEIIDRRGTDCIKYDAPIQQGWAKDTLPLWVADMDFPAPAAVGEALREMTRPGIFGYQLAGADYISSVTGWFDRRFGWKPEADWLVETPGVVFALCTAVRAFTKPGDAVMMLLPVYPHFFEAATDNGRRVVSSQLKPGINGRYEIDFDEVERLMDKEKPRLFILCSPHNPVGRVWTEEELRRLGELCFARNIPVVADEIHCDFTYPGHPHTPFLSLGPAFEQNGVSCTAPSKTFNLAGLQDSNIFIPNPMMRAAFQRKLRAQGVFGVNSAGRAAAKAAYDHGESWLRELLTYLRENDDFLRDFLARELPRLKAAPLEGTYLAWVDARELGLSDGELSALLRDKAHVRLNPGAEYGAGGEGFLRFNLACPRSTLRLALERIRDAVKEL